MAVAGSGVTQYELVVPRGNAPRSSGYQPDALLLSYRTENAYQERAMIQ